VAVANGAETGIPVLVLDSEPDELNRLSNALDDNCALHRAQHIDEACRILDTVPIQVIVCGQKPDEEEGLAFLTRSRTRFPKTQRILLLDKANPETVLKGLNEARLFRCLARPVSPSELVEAVEFAALEYDILQTVEFVSAERDRLEAELNSWPDRSRRVASGVTGILVHTSRLCIIGVGMVAVVLCVLALLAVVTLSVVYLCKTFLGIDMLQGLHLEDVLYRIFARLK